MMGGFGISFGRKVIIPERNSFHGRFINYKITSPGADNTTTFISFDSKGFLWSGTYTGLYRFDGIEYKEYATGRSDSTGLAGHQVTGILEDTTGRIWVSTFGALNCLDLKKGTFRHFFPDHKNLTSPGNMIHNMLEDRKGFIWLLTGRDLYRFDKDRLIFRRFILDSLSYLNTLNASSQKGLLIEDSSGRIWLASSYGLYQYDYSTDYLRVFRHNPADETSLPGNEVRYITEDKECRLWCTVPGFGLIQISDTEKGVFKQIWQDQILAEENLMDTIITILPDSKGNIWSFGFGKVSRWNPAIGSSDLFILPEPEKLLPSSHFPELVITNAWESSNGEIWFLHSLEGFLFRLNPENERITIYFIPNWSVFCSLLDNQDSFWFGCGDRNIWRLVLSGIPFTSTMVNNEFKVNLVNRKCIEENNGSIWFILSEGVFRSGKIDINSGFYPRRFTFPGTESTVTCIFKDRAGNIWVAENNGIISVINTAEKPIGRYRLPGGHTGPVTNIIEDLSGCFWFVSAYEIFYKPHNSETLSVFKSGDKGLDKAVSQGLFDIHIDQKLIIWFGLFGNGIYSYNIKDGRVTYFGEDNGLNIPYGDYCLRIDEDNKGRLWFLYFMNGLYLFDPGEQKFSRISFDNFREGIISYIGLLVESENTLRISHTKGFTFYNYDNGETQHLNFPQAAGFCYFFRTTGGALLYNQGQNLILFSDTASFNNYIPPIQITSLVINDQDYSSFYGESDELSDLNRINLKYSENNLRISFVSLNLLNSKDNMYRYFMSGIDKDTVTTSSGYRIAEYKKVKPGKYTFWVTGSNNDGLWNPEGRKLEIIINPPWYTSGISKVLYMFLLVSVVILIVKTRTDRLKMEKARLESIVRSRTSELENKNRQIEEMDRLKTTFFTEISHEIRTPLSLIVGPVDTILSETETITNEKTKRLLEVIKRNSLRLLKLVNQLLDISKIDAGKMRLNLEESDIFKCLRIIASGFLSVAEQRKIRFRIIIPDEPLITFFDHDKVEKILTNLLSNAFKYTSSGGIIICKINIEETFPEDNSPVLRIVVSDTGSGIAEENISRIFDRFFREEGHWEKDGGGTGIGLSLTRDFVKQMHGKINLQSKSGSGTTFEVNLPLGKMHLSDNEYIIVHESEEKKYGQDYNLCSYSDINRMPEEQAEEKLLLLIVEDNEDLCNYLKSNLVEHYSVIVTENGRSAFEIAVSKIPDIIISDIIIPELNGIDLCKKLKEDQNTSHIPVILLTAKVTAEDKITGLESGADDYLSKPFDIKELKARISNLISQREKLRLKYGLLTGLERSDIFPLNSDEKFIKRVAEIIKDNMQDFEFDTGALQEKLGISRMHLYRKIKALTGLTAHDLIQKCRMIEAARLLKLNAGNITEIALRTGFSNPSHFARCFREFYGVLPKDLKKESKNKTI